MTNEQSRDSPENNEQNQVTNREQNIVSTSSQNATAIVQNLDLVISQIGSQNTVTLSGQSRRNLEEEISENRLYKMTPIERQQLAQNFTGLDRIFYDKFVEKTGTIQKDASTRVGEGITIGVVSLVPGLGSAFSNELLNRLDQANQAREISFTVEEVREVFNKAGIGEVVRVVNALQLTKNQTIQMANGYETEISNKNEEIAKLRTQLDQAAQVAAEFTRQNTELRAAQEARKQVHEREVQEQQNLLETTEQVAVRTLREIQDEYNTLQQQAQAIRGEQERVAAELIAERQKSTDLMRLAEHLEIRKNLAVAQANRLLAQLESTETEGQGLKADKLILEANIRALTDEVDLKNTRNNQLAQEQVRLRDELKTTQDQKTEWEAQAKTNEANLQDQKNARANLNREISQLKEELNPSFFGNFTGWLSKKTGFKALKGTVGTVFNYAILGFFIWAFVKIWKAFKSNQASVPAPQPAAPQSAPQPNTTIVMPPLFQQPFQNQPQQPKPIAEDKKLEPKPVDVIEPEPVSNLETKDEKQEPEEQEEPNLEQSEEEKK